MKINLTSTVILFLFICFQLQSQKDNNLENLFTIDKEISITSIKNQYKTSACWSFSVLSMIESEIIEAGKDTVDLSEMYIVRNTYLEKAEKFVRMHGTIKFGGGGALNDPVDMMRKYGIVPEAVYNGLKQGEKNHDHHELDDVLKGYVDKIVLNEDGKLSPVWHKGFEKILDTYLGTVPKTFEYKGKTFTPQSFLKYLDINLDDYILISSFNHHPFYKPFQLEVPDNWSWGCAYNLPLDELVSAIDYSINNNYSVSWATDISEDGFDHKKGIAYITDYDWEGLGIEDDAKKKITQEIRQTAFNNYLTQDDHGMQVYGIAHDTTGAKYYLAKNSWGTVICGNDGQMYISENYIKCKTISVLFNRNGIPKAIQQKLKL